MTGLIDFNYKPLPWNIIFGEGSLSKLNIELEKLGFNKALILTTPNQKNHGKRILDIIGGKAAGHFDQAAMHVPKKTVNDAIKMAMDVKADCTVAIGGGSTTGLGKALAVKENLPNIVVPTTYAGSEMTNIWAVTENTRKVTARDIKAVPILTIYDPELTLSLPPEFAASSGLNAMAQAVVNIATDKMNAMVSTYAIGAVKALAKSLPAIKTDPKNMAARAEALYGACLAGAALGTGTTSLHHKICHTLGGSFNMPHAETHAILLPHSVAFNAVATPIGTAKLAAALNSDDAALSLYYLVEQLGGPKTLKEIGFEEGDIDAAAKITLETPFDNPETVTIKKLQNLLRNAFVGNSPQVYC